MGDSWVILTTRQGRITIDWEVQFFGTWKKPCYMKFVLVGLYCGPLLTLHKPKSVLVETVLVDFV